MVVRQNLRSIMLSQKLDVLPSQILVIFPSNEVRFLDNLGGEWAWAFPERYYFVLDRCGTLSWETALIEPWRDHRVLVIFHPDVKDSIQHLSGMNSSLPSPITTSSSPRTCGEFQLLTPF